MEESWVVTVPMTLMNQEGDRITIPAEAVIRSIHLMQSSSLAADPATKSVQLIYQQQTHFCLARELRECAKPRHARALSRIMRRLGARNTLAPRVDKG